MNYHKGSFHIDFKLQLIFLILLSFLIFAGNAWPKAKRISDMDIYTLPNQTRLTVRVSESKADPADITDKTLQEIQNRKREMLSLFNMTDWKVDKSHIKTKKRVTRAIMSGAYEDSSGQKTYWKEFHDYRQGRKLQMLLTNTDKQALNKDSRLSQIKKTKQKYEF